ncbi:MAG TPA: DUF6428 family protein [Chthoniobacterales bacterium]
MKTSAFKQILKQHPEAELAFVLPNGTRIPVHAHITEVGRVEKTFVDCGGKFRRVAACNLQSWVAEDLDHRLSAGKLAAIMDDASAIIGHDDPPVEIEFEDGWISQFPVAEASANASAVTFQLESKHTVCLARDVCLPEGAEVESESACCGTTGCC